MMRRSALFIPLIFLTIGCLAGGRGGAGGGLGLGGETTSSATAEGKTPAGGAEHSVTEGGPGGTAMAAGGDSPMPPHADSGDVMTHGDELPPTRREACRIYYVAGPKVKVLPGTGASLPELPFAGETALKARFYAETGAAPLSCEDPSCWGWEPVKPGQVVRMRLSRVQPSAPAIEFYQDAVVVPEESDGANLSFSGMPIKDGDEIEFYATFSESVFGFSATWAPLTDAVWEQWGAKCEMGGFKLDTGTVYYKTDRPGPADAIERAGGLIRFK